jgi:integrase
MTGEKAATHAALPLEQWPTADHDAWLAAIQPKGFLRKGGRGEAWRPASRRAVLGAYGRWLSYLSGQGIDLFSEAPPQRFTPARMEVYAAFILEGRSTITAANYFAVLCMAVIGMFPAEDWDWLRAIQKELRRQAVRTKTKHLAPADELFSLGTSLLTQAGALLDSANLPLRQRHAAARDFRDGLIIALLAVRPLRIKNFVETEIGTHLRQTSTWTTIEFTGDETKTHAPIRMAWPEDLLVPLTRYLDEVRPLLITAPMTGGNVRRPGEPGARLWVGQGGTAFSPGGLNLALARHTKQKFGHALTAHRFRDSVATAIANDDPSKLRLAAEMLGHKRVTTTEGHYIAQDNTQLFADHHARIEALRHPGGRHDRRRQKSESSIFSGRCAK